MPFALYQRTYALPAEFVGDFFLKSKHKLLSTQRSLMRCKLNYDMFLAFICFLFYLFLIIEINNNTIDLKYLQLYDAKSLSDHLF